MRTDEAQRKARSAPAAVARTPSQLVTSMMSMARIMPECRREHDRDERLVEPGPLDSGQSRMRHPRADQATDQGMTGGRRDALQPGDDVPEHGADERAEDDGGSDQILVDDPLADRVRDPVQLRHGKREEVSGEVEEGGEGDRGHRLEQARRNDGSDGVGGIVQPVQKVERQRDEDQADQQRKGELVHVSRLTRGRSRCRRFDWRRPRTRRSPFRGASGSRG